MLREQPFQIESPFKPTGDQPQAIEKLVEGFQAGKKLQILMGVTGSGKTFTMALCGGTAGAAGAGDFA